MTAQNLKHATFVFERTCAAPVERVSAAFANPAERAKHRPNLLLSSTMKQTSESEAATSFAADKNDPQYRGVTIYYDVVPNRRIVSSETVETAGKILLISSSEIALGDEMLELGGRVGAAPQHRPQHEFGREGVEAAELHHLHFPVDVRVGRVPAQVLDDRRSVGAQEPFSSIITFWS